MDRRRHNHRSCFAPVRALLAAAATILFLTDARAADPPPVTLTAEVNPPTVVAGDRLRYRLTISSSSGVQTSDPDMPSFDPFTVIDQNQGSTIQIMNRRQTVSFTYDVILRSAKEGTFTFAPAKATLNGATYESNPVTVVVSRQAQETVPATAEGVAGLEGFISARTGDPNIDKQIKGRLFLYTEVTKTDVVPYEPVIARTYVYKAPGLVDGENYGFADEAPASGADYLRLPIYRLDTERGPWESMDKWEPVQVGNATFLRGLVEVVALVPTKTGDIDFRGPVMGSALPVRGATRNDPFGDPFGDPFASFFGRDRKTAELPPAPRQIHVRPLPQPQPKEFSGIVGDFKIAAAVDRPEMKEGEVVTYTLTFSGEGYAEAIPEPALPALDGFSLFDKKSNAESRPGQNGVEGLKTFEFILRASKPGGQSIPPRSFVLYSPSEKKYKTVSTEAVSVEVKPGEQNVPYALVASGQAGGSNRGEIRQLATDIVHIHTGDWDPTPGMTAGIYARPAWWFLPAIPIAMLLAALFVRQRRKFYLANPDIVRRGRAGADAERRLRVARKYLVAQESDKFYSEVASAVRGFLGGKIGREPSGLTNDEISDYLSRHDVDAELREHTVRLLDACDTARYALASDAHGSRQSTYDEASFVLRRLREALS